MLALVALTVAAVAASACGFLAPAGVMPDRGMEPVGPRIELGPVRTFGAGDVAGLGDAPMVFFETRDGWCLESPQGGSCAGGGGLPTQGFTGFGGTEGPDRTCIEAMTGKDVVELVVDTGDGTTTRLPPLPGSADAPVNVFAACWAAALPFEQITAEAFGADGQPIGTNGR